jgi:hypothetical protein
LIEILIGTVMAVLALRRNTKFYEGSLGVARQIVPPLEESWMRRIICFFVGLAVIFDGIWKMFGR